MRVLLKALALFVLCNLLFTLVEPLPGLGGLSGYNRIFPGRLRLPYADHPERAYSVSVLNLDAMFASHLIAAGPKPADEYRVILIGDSSTWGWLLKPEDTLAGQINRANLKTANGRIIRAYNLGYPIMSLTKDVLIIDRAMQYQPDAIVWLMTFESFPADKRLFHPLLQNNPGPTRRLIDQYGLKVDPNDAQFFTPSFWDRTIIGRRRDIADMLRLQLYGPLWAATGIDQDYVENYERAAIDLDSDPAFHGLQPPSLGESDLAFDALAAGMRAIGKTPLLVVNEPILVSNGKNSGVRYDFFYPRWAYDQYRGFMAAKAQSGGWNYLDLWNLIPMTEFTNSAVHYAAGARLLADQIEPEVLRISSGQR